MPARIPNRHNDLFDIFPDLPRARPRQREERLLRLRRLMIETRQRAARRIAEQRTAVERIRARVETLKRRRFRQR